MRAHLLLAVIVTVAGSHIAAAEASECQGGIWQEVRARVRPQMDLGLTVAILRSKGYAFDSFDLREHPYEPGVREYQARGIELGCAVYIADWQPVVGSGQGCFPFASKQLEYIRIDFDAEAQFVGLSCTSSIAKVACDEAEHLSDSGDLKSVLRLEDVAPFLGNAARPSRLSAACSAIAPPN